MMDLDKITRKILLHFHSKSGQMIVKYTYLSRTLQSIALSYFLERGEVLQFKPLSGERERALPSQGTSESDKSSQ